MVLQWQCFCFILALESWFLALKLISKPHKNIAACLKRAEVVFESDEVTNLRKNFVEHFGSSIIIDVVGIIQIAMSDGGA